MTYTQLFEHIYSESDGIKKRINALDPATRKAWMVLEVFSDRKGFDHWWDDISDGIHDEIFDELVHECGQDQSNRKGQG
jgi:hypothetical protein